MADSSRPRVLFVDDEPNLLAGILRTLRSEHFQVCTASSGAAALDALNSEGPFAVIVSDLHMPEMDGVTLLQKARQCAPDAIRVMFTGQPDLTDAIEAVNKGAIFRFLVKPCSRVMLALTLKAAIEQHRLLTSERALLEQTLHGSIQALTEILSLAAPAAFGRATRVRQTVCSLVSACGISESWHIEVAAMLSQVGCATLPPSTAEKVYEGKPLNDAEQEMIGRMPAVVEQVLGNIPRLEPVLEILRSQDHRLESGENVSWGARALKLALDLDVLENQGNATSLALDTLRARAGCYDAEMLEKLATIRHSEKAAQIQEMSITGLRPGMVLAEDVRTNQGALLLARGQEVSTVVLEKLHNLDVGAAEIEGFQTIKTRLAASSSEGQIPNIEADGIAEKSREGPSDPALDPVTGLPSRIEAERELGLRWQAEDRCYGLVVVIDSLTSINSRFGRNAGDELLRSYGEFIRGVLSPGDRLFRWSGPSLLVLRIPKDDVDFVCDQFRIVLERNKFSHTARTSTRTVLLPVFPRWTVIPAMQAVDQFIAKIDSFVGAILLRDRDRLGR